ELKGAPFEKLQALPRNEKPITSWNNRDAAFAQVIAEIRRVVEELNPASINASSSLLPLVWNVPYRRNPFFTGRADVLKQVRDKLVTTPAAPTTQPLAISGLGGIGKTQVTVEYAYRFRSDYQAVLWVHADAREA